MAKNGLRAAGLGGPVGPFSEAVVAEFQKSDIWIEGAFSLEQGFLFTSMLLAAAVVAVIERRWERAAVWTAAAATLSALGLMHSYRWTPGDTVLALTPAWPAAIGYAVMSALFLSARWLTEEGSDHG
jgi:AGZA family xanthine/uracil permease-like MFS transporter